MNKLTTCIWNFPGCCWTYSRPKGTKSWVSLAVIMSSVSRVTVSHNYITVCKNKPQHRDWWKHQRKRNTEKECQITIKHLIPLSGSFLKLILMHPSDSLWRKVQLQEEFTKVQILLNIMNEKKNENFFFTSIKYAVWVPIIF